MGSNNYNSDKVYILSKSTYVRASQCVKSLYLNKHYPKLRTPPNAAKLALFGKGRSFEQTFKDTFIGATDVSAMLGKQINEYPAYTSNLLQQHSSITLFEAGIVYNEVLILTDVLQKNEDGSISIYEVKHSTKLNDGIQNDLALQYYVAKAALGTALHKFVLVLRNEADNTFNQINMTDELALQSHEVALNCDAYKEILTSGIIPNITMGAHCNKPYTCDFKDYCSKQPLTLF